MGEDRDSAIEIMYLSEKISKHKCPHDARANASFWVVLTRKGLPQTQKDPTLAIHCEGTLRTNLHTMDFNYKMYHIMYADLVLHRYFFLAVSTNIHTSSTNAGASTAETFISDSSNLLTTSIVLGIVALLVALMVAFAVVYRKKIRAALNTDPGDEEMTQDSKCKSGIVPISGILEGKLDMPSKDEFERLFKYQDKIESKLTTYQGKRNNDRIGLNAKADILPYDHNRIKLKNLFEGSDYINASLISSLRRSEEPSYDEIIYTSYVPTFQIEFIVGQEPNKNTFTRHFQMLHEQRVHVVISLHRGKGTNKLILDKVDSFHNMTRKTVKKIQVSDTMCVYIYELFDTTSVETQYKTQVLFFEIFNFPKWDDFDVEDARNILSNISSIRKQIKAKNNRLKMMVYDDEAGSCGASLFVALYDMLENVDGSVNEENQLKKSAEDVKVFDVVNGLRKDRMMMVNTFSAYKFLHMCLMEYGPNKKTYDAIQSKQLNTSNLSKDRKIVLKKATPGDDILDTYSLDSVEYLLPDEYLIPDEYVI